MLHLEFVVCLMQVVPLSLAPFDFVSSGLLPKMPQASFSRQNQLGLR